MCMESLFYYYCKKNSSEGSFHFNEGKRDMQAYNKNQSKVCVQAKWPIQPELIPVSVALSD